MIASGEWILERALGSGATATVSLASTSSSGEIFAVKSSPISRSSILRREQSILSSLASPHIITCLGSEVSGEFYHLFLELAEGGALADLAGRVDEPKIRSFTRQILLALRYLHSNGVSHCDVKGRNVLLASDGRVKLGDFGCARRAGEKEAPGVMNGTPAFMAPEVARGEEQGAAGDIWALGCTVVEMASGGSPWPEIADPLSAIYRIGFTADVPAIPAWISEEGKDFVLKCFARDPKQRWTAEMLLRHPFVAGVEEFPPLSSSEKAATWVSPKSTLDFGLWDLEEKEEEDDDDDDDDDDDELDVISDRIQQLVSPGPAEWTWSESWIVVRSPNVMNTKEEETSSATDFMEVEQDMTFSSSSSYSYSSVGEMEAEHATDDMIDCCEWVSTRWKRRRT